MYIYTYMSITESFAVKQKLSQHYKSTILQLKSSMTEHKLTGWEKAFHAFMFLNTLYIYIYEFGLRFLSFFLSFFFFCTIKTSLIFILVS